MSSSRRSGGSRSEPLPAEQIVVRLIEEGVSLAPISRATGIDVDDLRKLPVARTATVLSAEELGQKAGQVANRALDEALRILDEGSETSRIRLISAVASFPLRRMQTDSSKQLEQMQQLLSRILTGGRLIEEGEDE